MTEYTIYVIIVKLAVWLVVFIKLMKRDIYKAILIADFVVTTIDFVLLFTPLRSTIFTITLFSKKTGRTILSIPITFGMVLLVKSIIFYLLQEVFPDFVKNINSLLKDEEEVKMDEHKKRLTGNNYR